MDNPFNQWGPPIVTAMISGLLSVWYTRKKTSDTFISNLVEGLIARIEQVAESASLYYSSAPDADIRSREVIINHQVSSISREIYDICKRNDFAEGKRLSPKPAMIAFRKAITGGTFQTLRREPLPPDSPVYVAITISRDDLISALRSIQFGD